MAISEERTQHRTVDSGRLRFVLGEQATDVALPTEVPLADLLPAVLPQFGAEWIEQGADHEGWVVQRVGEEPLDEDRTLTELGLLDGETVYLRPRADELAPIDYDDLVDGVGERARNNAGSWSPARTRWMFRFGGTLLLLLGFPLLLGAGPVVMQTAVAGGMTVLLLVGSALVARGAANLLVATILAGLAAGYGALTGTLLLLALAPAATAVQMLSCGCAGALVALVTGLLAVADSALLFTGALTFVTALGIAGLIGSVSPATPLQAAAIGLVLTLIASLFIPTFAFRLAGLTLPMLPTNPAQLTEDIDPVPHRIVVERGTLTVGYSKALHLGIGAAQSILVLEVLAGEIDGWVVAFSLVTALLLFLRARHPDGTVQRWAVITPGLICVLTNVLLLAVIQDTLARVLGFWLVAVVIGSVLLVAGEFLPGRRLRPYWGRAADIFESLTAIAALPLLLQVLNVYAMMRGLAG
ncbi:type VII secretion integral membrane protein EccD [Saccharopolyspora sp. NPDC002686]|uniref:type VII secretion integral membrane protein EccD n=1 Tax=Saccharopolyspora sp. NPDC002686 TaxID=3154541 RepID=UPI00332FE971